MRTIALALVIGGATLIGYYTSASAAPLRLDITSSDLSGGCVDRDREEMFLRLNKSGGERLSQLTTQHVGRRAQIVLNGWQIAEAPVMAPVESGRILLKVPLEELTRLQSEFDLSECYE